MRFRLGPAVPSKNNFILVLSYSSDLPRVELPSSSYKRISSKGISSQFLRRKYRIKNLAQLLFQLVKENFQVMWYTKYIFHSAFMPSESDMLTCQQWRPQTSTLYCQNGPKYASCQMWFHCFESSLYRIS